MRLDEQDRTKMLSLLAWVADHGGGTPHPADEPTDNCPSCHAAYLFSVVATQRADE